MGRCDEALIPWPSHHVFGDGWPEKPKYGLHGCDDERELQYDDPKPSMPAEFLPAQSKIPE